MAHLPIIYNIGSIECTGPMRWQTAGQSAAARGPQPNPYLQQQQGNQQQRQQQQPQVRNMQYLIPT
jgi:hypothetical protein